MWVLYVLKGEIDRESNKKFTNFQLRICSAHFEGGEKKEGDIPVPDPTVKKPTHICKNQYLQVDKQLNIELPPKEHKSGERRRNKSMFQHKSENSLEILYWTFSRTFESFSIFS